MVWCNGDLSYLRLDQYQINKEHYGIVLYVFVAEASTVLADCESHPVAAGSIICSRIFGVKCLDWKATFYADWHRIYEWCSFEFVRYFASTHIVVFWFRVLLAADRKTRFRGFCTEMSSRSPYSTLFSTFTPPFFRNLPLHIVRLEHKKEFRSICRTLRVRMLKHFERICVTVLHRGRRRPPLISALIKSQD